MTAGDEIGHHCLDRLQTIDHLALVLEIQGRHTLGQIDGQYDVDPLAENRVLAHPPLGPGQGHHHEDQGQPLEPGDRPSEAQGQGGLQPGHRSQPRMGQDGGRSPVAQPDHQRQQPQEQEGVG